MEKKHFQNRCNYHYLLNKEIENIKENGDKPSLLLHSCCAPCSSYVLEYLAPFFHLILFFYNPNIHPEKEYLKRLEEQKRVIKEMPLNQNIHLIEGPYDPNIFLRQINGLEKDKEGGKRCFVCYKLRLDRTAQKSLEIKTDYFTTTLTVSPHKNAQIINQIGKEMENKYRTKYLFSDFKKRDGFKRSIVLSNQYKLYRQNYCGCLFSKDKTIN